MRIPRQNDGHRIYTKELAKKYIKDFVVDKPKELNLLQKIFGIGNEKKSNLFVRRGLGIHKLGAVDYLKKYYRVIFVD